jgi:hypothetical protein
MQRGVGVSARLPSEEEAELEVSDIKSSSLLELSASANSAASLDLDSSASSRSPRPCDSNNPVEMGTGMADGAEPVAGMHAAGQYGASGDEEKLPKDTEA